MSNNLISSAVDISGTFKAYQNEEIMEQTRMLSSPPESTGEVPHPQEGGGRGRRRRRRYFEVDRAFYCDFPDCGKGYGTLNHLNTHIKIQKHGLTKKPMEFRQKNSTFMYKDCFNEPVSSGDVERGAVRTSDRNNGGFVMRDAPLLPPPPPLSSMYGYSYTTATPNNPASLYPPWPITFPSNAAPTFPYWITSHPPPTIWQYPSNIPPVVSEGKYPPLPSNGFYATPFPMMLPPLALNNRKSDSTLRTEMMEKKETSS